MITPQHEQDEGRHTETCSTIWQRAGVAGINIGKFGSRCVWEGQVTVRGRKAQVNLIAGWQETGANVKIKKKKRPRQEFMTKA